MTNTQQHLTTLEEIPKLQRQELVLQQFISRRTEDASFRLDSRQVALRSASLEEYLTAKNIHPDDYNKIYLMSLEIYNPSKGKRPYGIDDVVSAVKIFLDGTRKLVQPELKKVKPNCEACNDTGYLLKGLKPVIETRNNKKYYLKCKECQNENKRISEVSEEDVR